MRLAAKIPMLALALGTMALPAATAQDPIQQPQGPERVAAADLIEL